MDFFDLKGVVEGFLDRLGFKPQAIEFNVTENSETYGPRCAEVCVNGQSLGFMGELHPKVRAALGLPAVHVCAAEFRLQPLVKPHWTLDPMPPISNYPPVVEDLAFEVPQAVTVRQTQEAIVRAGGERVAAVELFDVYRGDPLPAQHKSLAYRLTYQSPERSLSDKEVTQLRQRIVAAVEKETGGKLRSI